MSPRDKEPNPKQKNKKFKQKEYDFKPSREQMIRGAFFDLAKPINKKPMHHIARQIAELWGERI